MTQNHERAAYRSPEAIRSESFSYGVRGLDEEEVRQYLGLLADQVAAADREREELRAEADRLRGEAARRAGAAGGADAEVNPEAVLLLSQAQEVADQLVEEAVVHARDLMTSARNQQREILEQAHRAAESAAREAAEVAGRQLVGATAGGDSDSPVPEIEYVRTFARVAQVQLRSVIDALAEQVDRLGDVPRLDARPSSRS